MSGPNELLARLHRLPTLPAAVREVMDSLEDNDLDSADLAHKIARDQGLSARMLRVANSPFYGLPRKVGSIQDAVAVMGLSSVRSLVLAAGFMHAFPPVQHGAFDRRAYWKRSFRVACYAQALAQCLRQDLQAAFIAGMFHDVGQLVLDICAPEEFAALLQQQEASGSSLIEIERSALGFDHALVGAEMARRWNFPVELEHAIRYWRTPEREPFEPVTGIVHLAVLFESGQRGDPKSPLSEILRDKLKIDWICLGACLPESGRIDAEADLMMAA